MMNHFVIPYSTTKYPFDNLLSDTLYSGFPLHGLDLTIKEYTELFEVGKDSCTALHEMFYAKIRDGWPEFSAMYQRFISDKIAPLYTESFLYQKTPTIRFHLPGNLAVGAFHTDAEFNHPTQSVNYIIPCTEASDTASVWVESEPGKNDYAPFTLYPGELIAFKGTELRHGNKVNETFYTRVSMDFRVLKLSDYDENYAGESMTRKTKFRIGEYYSLYEKQ